MNKRQGFPLLLILFFLTLHLSYSNPNPPATDLYVKWEVLENVNGKEVKFRNQFTLINKSNTPLTNGWAIFFNTSKTILGKPENIKISIDHINGDLYKMYPQQNFQLSGGDSLFIPITSDGLGLNVSDAPSGMYIAWYDEATKKESSFDIIKNYIIKPFDLKVLLPRFPKPENTFITPEGTFDHYSKITELKEDKLLPFIPSPVAYKYGKQDVVIDAGVSIIADPSLGKEKTFLNDMLNGLLSSPVVGSGKGTIELKLAPVKFQGKSLKNGDEAYFLEAKPGRIVITGTDSSGVFYGIQTLKALFSPEVFKGKNERLAFKEITITDFPSLHYRGMHLDVGRNFQSKESVLKLLDVMALYKLNKFHFHITDDEGWRLQIKDMPELTEVGGKRSHSSNPKEIMPSFGSGPGTDNSGSGFYTREEFIEILKYATERHIEVIPEVDLPGHARAAIKSMDARYERLMKDGKEEEAKVFLLRDILDKSEYKSVQGWKDNVICICQESTYYFIGAVVKDIVSMFKEANAPLKMIHTGGDEVPKGVWEKSPVCQNLIESNEDITSSADLPYYFLQRVDAILNRYNLQTGGWEEIALRRDFTGKQVKYSPNPQFVDSAFVSYVWNNLGDAKDYAYKLANAGYKVVLSDVTNLYFDLAYNEHPQEIGYFWGGYVDNRKPYEFLPYNVYYSMFTTSTGEKIDQKKLYEQNVKLNPESKKNILGIQGQLWTENTTSEAIMDYLVYPKLISLAERAWHIEPEWSKSNDQATRLSGLDASWNVFVNTVGKKDLPRLDNLHNGIQYRVSPPGAKKENGMVKVNVEFPGLTVRYTTDGTEPTTSSQVYKNPIPAKGTIKLKAFTTNNRSSRTVEVN